ncbi:MAG: 4-hydroxy-3-methylbut-2-enyl diphosphate reductase [Lachnospiraceae bacterium]|nr:4-hydroxy-3-methylbut-2-enyl diphosphate reductase [Lachnospiraceae bacterium]
MEVRLAEPSGFCFGVNRAVDTVYDKLNTDKIIYTYGPIVHNDSVVNELSDRGVKVLEDEKALRALDPDEIRKTTGKEAAVIIRAHGIPQRLYELLHEKNIECIDATCPFVKKIHRVVQEESEKGRHIVIVGNPKHPEVEGIVGWCNGFVTVIESAEEAETADIPKEHKICIVSQTTFNLDKFKHIVEIFRQRGYNDNVVNTICNATKERQDAAKALATEADAMIVIGGRHSSNSKKLFDICAEVCTNTYFIRTLDDLEVNEEFRKVRLVGITAGASTPNKLIEEVQNYVRINF